jgi:hypothetical protein
MSTSAAASAASASTLAPAYESPRAPGGSRVLMWRGSLAAVLLSAILAIAYLVLAPPAADLAAAAYRADLFSRVGFALWDNGWYGGHLLLGYSVLSPPFSALVGVRLSLALSTMIATALFAAIAVEAFGARAGAVAATWFAVSLGGEMLAGRVPYELGLAIGLGALLAFQRKHLLVSVSLALVTSLASPVAGAFLALAGAAAALSAYLARSERRSIAPSSAGAVVRGRGETRSWDGLWLAAASLTPIALLAVAFPEGGCEPFAAGEFWPELAAVAVIALAMPRRWHTLRVGAWLYALALAAAYAVETPAGGNIARLGSLFAGPLVAAVLWDRHRRLLALLAPALLYWQLVTPVGDLLKVARDPSLQASYYAPLTAELHRLTDGAPTRIEVPMTGAHWESVFLTEAGGLAGTRGLELARGWERQLDTSRAALFYSSRLTPAAYRAWLYENAIAYVALPDVRLDSAGREEGELIRRGLPYLSEVWRSRHWRLYAVPGAPALVATPARVPARVGAVGADFFTLLLPRAGSYQIHLRFNPYWAITNGRGCVREAPGGWTTLNAKSAGRVRVGTVFSLMRVFEHGARCR